MKTYRKNGKKVRSSDSTKAKDKMQMQQRKGNYKNRKQHGKIILTNSVTFFGLSCLVVV